MSNTNVTLYEKYGPGLGSHTGAFSWPFAACVGKVTQDGRYVSTTVEEAHKICLEACDAMNRPLDKVKCTKLYNQYKNVSEHFEQKPTLDNSNLFILISLFFLISIILILLVRESQNTKK